MLVQCTANALQLRLRPKSSDALEIEIIWLAQNAARIVQNVSVHDNHPRESGGRCVRRSGERRSGERRSGGHSGAMTDDGTDAESLKKWRPGSGSGNARARTKEMRKEGERRARDKELRSEQRAAEAKARAPPNAPTVRSAAPPCKADACAPSASSSSAYETVCAFDRFPACIWSLLCDPLGARDLCALSGAASELRALCLDEEMWAPLHARAFGTGGALDAAPADARVLAGGDGGHGPLRTACVESEARQSRWRTAARAGAATLSLPGMSSVCLPGDKLGASTHDGT
jgi:hypothetical protein